MVTRKGEVDSAVVPAQLSNINHDDPQDTDVVQVLRDRLRGNGAWNGQGLLLFLATTSRKDREREWMEPLKDLAEKVVYAVEDGEPMPKLTKDEREKVDELLTYSKEFHAALAAGRTDEAAEQQP